MTLMQRKSRAASAAVYLGLLNALITGLVFLSPIGEGDGSGVIGYSVYRLIIAVFPQGVLALSGIIAAFRAMKKNLNWIPGMAINIIVIVVTVFLYFAN